jgi:hypothetical protein
MDKKMAYCFSMLKLINIVGKHYLWLTSIPCPSQWPRHDEQINYIVHISSTVQVGG